MKLRKRIWKDKMDCVILRSNFYRPDGGIGRRSRLKICRSQGCAGSIPVPGTEVNKSLAGISFQDFFVLI